MNELTDRLSRAAGGPPGFLDIADLHRRADRQRRRHRTVRGIGIVAVALVVIAAAVLAVSSRSSTTEVAHPNRTPAGISKPGHWVPIANAPIRPRRNAMTVWTGSEVLVFGGFSSIMGKNCYEDEAAPRCGDGPSGELRSAASYDPSTDTWRRIAPLPAGTSAYQPQSESASGNSPLARLNTQVLDGQVYVVADYDKRPLSPALLAYNLDTDRWRIVTTLRSRGGETWALTAWDGKLVTYVADGRGDAIPYDRIYDPKTGRWSDASEPPDGDAAMTGIRPSTSRQVIGVGDKLYVFATTDAVPEGQDRVAAGTSVMVAIYDGDHWSLVTHVTKPLLGSGIWTVTGDHFTFVVPSHLTLPPGASHPPWGPTVITFDPATRKFTEPQPPDTVDAHLAQGNAPVLGNGRSAAVITSTSSLILDGDTGSWTPAVGPSSAVIDDFASTRAGDQLFLWGGATAATAESEASLSGRGWLWTPPTSDGTSAAPTSTSPAVVGEPGRWVPIAKAPIQPRRNAMSVWTGSEALVFGGFSRSTPTQSVCPYLWSGTALACPDGYHSPVLPRDAAAYHPTTNSWSRIAPVPDGYALVTTTTQTKTRSAAVVGGKVYVVGWKSPTPASTTRRHLLSYDPGSDDWSVLGPIGSNSRSAWQLTTLGDELVAFPQSVRPGKQSAHIYDPGSDTWRDVPLPTSGQDHGGATNATPLQLIGTKSALYLFYLADRPGSSARESGGNSSSDIRPASGFAAQVAVFDGHDWKQFTAPDSSSAQGHWLQTGDRFTMFGVATSVVPSGDEGPTPLEDLIFDPATSSFSKRPSRLPTRMYDALDHADTVAQGDAVARVHSTLLEVLAPTQDHWLTFDGPSSEILDSFATTWVGDQLFFWGGHFLKRPGKDAVISDQGWIWTPPKSDGTSPSPPSTG